MASSRPQGSKDTTSEYARIASYYDVPDVSNVRKLFFLASDTFNDYLVSTGKRDFDEIIPNLYIGRIPCKDGFSLPDNLGMVVSVVAYQEMSGKGLFKSVFTSTDWKERNVEHIHVNMQDMTAAASPEDMLDACLRMKKFRDNAANDNKAIYVHCKAGRSRSVMLVAIFLATFGNSKDSQLSGDPKEIFYKAYDYIKGKRPQADVLAHQAVLGYEALSLFSHEATKTHGDVSYSSMYQYLGSLAAKDEIRRLTSFQALAEYATEIQYFIIQNNRTNQVRNFFTDILTSKDGSWYDRLVNLEGAIKALLEADKGDSEYGIADKERRIALVDNFTKEINQLLVDKGLMKPAELITTTTLPR